MLLNTAQEMPENQHLPKRIVGVAVCLNLFSTMSPVSFRGTEEMCLHGDCLQNGSLHGSSHEASTVLFRSCNKANDSVSSIHCVTNKDTEHYTEHHIAACPEMGTTIFSHHNTQGRKASHHSGLDQAGQK